MVNPVEGSTAGEYVTQRRRFSNREKLTYVRNVEKRIKEGKAIREACRELRIQPKQYRSWKKTTAVMVQRRPLAFTICKGRKSILDPMENELLAFEFELREQGMSVSISMVSTKASTLSREFREKSREAKMQSV